MRLRSYVLGTVLLALAATGSVFAETKPYADLTDRDIKALSDGDVQGLLDGAGMGLALSAELNGYPGPKHVLDLADDMSLSAEQQRIAQSLFYQVKTEARRLGRQIVEQEAVLDRAFSDGTIDQASLNAAMDHLGALQAQLRAVHLAAHLDMRNALSDHQVALYNTARGYTNGDAGAHQHRHHHGSGSGH